MCFGCPWYLLDFFMELKAGALHKKSNKHKKSVDAFEFNLVYLSVHSKGISASMKVISTYAENSYENID